MSGWKLKLGALAFLAVGYAGLGGALYFLVAHTVFWIRAESTEGRVVGHQEMERSHSRRLEHGSVPANATVVAFRTRDGEEIVSATDWGSSVKVYPVGDTVTVLYMLDDPVDMKIRGFVSLYAGPLMLLVMGAVFWIAGTFVQIATEEPGKRRRRQ